MNKFMRSISSIFVFIILIPLLYAGSVFAFCITKITRALPRDVSGLLIYCDDFTSPGILLLIGLPILSGFLVYLFFWKNHREYIKSDLSKEDSLKLESFHKKFTLWRNLFIGSVVLDGILLYIIIYHNRIANPVVSLTLVFIFIWISLILTIIYHIKSRKKIKGG